MLVGDHDECDPSLAQVMHEKIAGSKLVIFPKAGHMTFVDQPELFVKVVDEFLHGGAGETGAGAGAKNHDDAWKTNS